MAWYNKFRKQGWAMLAFKGSVAVSAVGFAFFLVVYGFSPPHVGSREFAIVFILAVLGPLVLVNASTLLLWLTAQLTPGYQRLAVMLAPASFLVSVLYCSTRQYPASRLLILLQSYVMLLCVAAAVVAARWLMTLSAGTGRAVEPSPSTRQSSMGTVHAQVG
jgi:hypothetical protein